MPKIGQRTALKRQEKFSFYIKIRTYENDLCTDIWFMKKSGAAHESLMHGVTFRELCEKMAEATGLPVVREHRNYFKPEPDVEN